MVVRDSPPRAPGSGRILTGVSRVSATPLPAGVECPGLRGRRAAWGGGGCRPTAGRGRWDGGVPVLVVSSKYVKFVRPARRSGSDLLEEDYEVFTETLGWHQILDKGQAKSLILELHAAHPWLGLESALRTSDTTPLLFGLPPT